MASEWEYRFPGYEQWVWSALETLSGTEQGHDFALQALGLIYFKFVCDRFAQRYYELLAEGRGREEEPAAYAEAGFCYVPRGARWFQIVSADDGDKAAVLEDAMRIAEQLNPSLAGLLPQGLSALNGEALALAVERLHYICMAEPAQRCKLDRDCFAYALSSLAERDQRLMGQCCTPSGVAQLMSAVMQIHGGCVYDPCCGSGNLLIQAAAFADKTGMDRLCLKGQERDPALWKIAKMNMDIHGLEADLGSESGDVFQKDLHPGLMADYVLADPPFHERIPGDEEHLGRISAQYADYAWIRQALEHMGPNGRMGILLPNNDLSATRAGAKEFRKSLVEEDLVEIIIQLPARLYPGTRAVSSLLILSKRKFFKGMTLFVDAQTLGTQETRMQRVIKEEDIEKITELCRRFYSGRTVNKSGFCAVASRGDIAGQDYVLSPVLYIDVGFIPGDGVPMDEKMKHLTGELSALLHQSRTRETNMRRMLEAIGYEM